MSTESGPQDQPKVKRPSKLPFERDPDNFPKDQPIALDSGNLPDWRVYNIGEKHKAMRRVPTDGVHKFMCPLCCRIFFLQAQCRMHLEHCKGEKSSIVATLW